VETQARRLCADEIVESMSGAENGGEMTALSKDGGRAFGVHAFIWAGEWTREGKRSWCARMKENRSSQGQV
jgi:hypothetical protein